MPRFLGTTARSDGILIDVDERAARRDDLPALVQLWRRFEVATSGAAETVETDVRGDWEAPGFDLRLSTLVLQTRGEIVGYAALDAEGGADSVIDLDCTDEDVADRLLGWLEDRGAAQGTSLQHYWGASDAVAAARFVRRGWVDSRTFWRMRLELDMPTPQPVWPPGVSVRGFELDRDTRSAHELVATAFADIGDGPVRGDEDAWARAMLDPERFDAGISVVGERDGELVTVCLTHAMEGFAFIRQLAVRRDQRGAGLGLAMLHESFRRHASRGFAATVLGVDAANATGATELYRRAGMRVVEQFTRWEFTVDR